MRWLVLLAVVLGCGGRAGSPPTRASAADRFARVHRLIDLYDTARFTHAADARAALGRELGVEVGTGRVATDRVVAALLVEVDRVLAADRLHAGAQAARTLLEFDSRPPAVRAELLQRMAEVKAIARGRGPMAANARLRLAGYCWRALDDATRAVWRQRPFAVSHCLYALHDSDPDPYFDPDPDRRPPLPAWKDLVTGSRALLADQRLAEADRALAAALDALEESAGEMPVEPVSEVMVSADGPLYDWTPVADASTSADALRERIQGDGRGQVALRLDPNGKDELMTLAETARRAGASEIQLLVAHRQKLDAPPGDYWHGRTQVTRAAVIPISLAPLGDTASTGAPSPDRVDFAAGLQLTLVIGATRWRLVGRGGELAAIAIDRGASPTRQLTTALERVRAAYPDQRALALVVTPGTASSQVIAAAAAAAWREGRPFFRLGMAKSPPAVAGSWLARRVAVRARAVVEVVPGTLAARRPALLACYQNALDKAPALAGTVRLEPKDGKAIAVGAADRALAACAIAALGTPLIESGATSAEVTFRAPTELH